jgi:DNA-binding response OmpR family regulator
VPRVLLATDADWIHEEVDAALAGDDISVVRVSQGTEVRPAVQAGGIDLVVLDLQIGNMGGMAACMDLRLDESVDKLPHVPVLMLLDRPVDSFLASRSDADGWVVKPLDAFSLRRAASALLAGELWQPDTGPDAGVVVVVVDDLEAEAAEAAAAAAAAVAAAEAAAQAEAEAEAEAEAAAAAAAAVEAETGDAPGEDAPEGAADDGDAGPEAATDQG